MIHPLKAIINLWNSGDWRKREEIAYFSPPKPFHLPGWDEAYVELKTGEHIKLCDIDEMAVVHLPDARCFVHYGVKRGNGRHIEGGYVKHDGKIKITSDAQERFSTTTEGIKRTLETRIRQEHFGII